MNKIKCKKVNHEWILDIDRLSNNCFYKIIDHDNRYYCFFESWMIILHGFCVNYLERTYHWKDKRLT